MRWKYYPWLAALALAPLMYGAVDPGGQTVAGLLLGFSWLLLAPEISARSERIIPLPFAFFILILAVFYIVPLPADLIKVLSPERFQMARRFAINPGGPTWIFLSSSVAGSIQRYWEIGLIIAAFQIARQAVKHPGLPLALIGTLTATVIFLAASEAWRRWAGEPIWRTTSSASAGTFANRDHFADWLCVCMLFLVGWVLRSFWPLQSFRTARVHRHPWTGLIMLSGLVSGLIAAVSSSSRGAFLALVAGVVAWSFLLTTQTRSQKRMAALVLVGLAGLVVLLLSGDLLLKRLADTGSTFAVKVGLWRDALRLFPKYWAFGTGLGTFERIYPPVKSLFPGVAVLHAENELVEQLLETGVIGIAILMACSILSLGHFTRLFTRRSSGSELSPAGGASKKGRRECDEPELLFGAIAGLAGFLAHSLFEFVLHIPANALLASTLFGIVAGMADGPRKSISPAPPSPFRVSLHFFAATGLLLIAALQGLALFHWQKAEQNTSFPIRRLRETGSAVHLWPFDSHRLIVMVRTEVIANQNQSLEIQNEGALRMDNMLARAISLDELNWELRLEKCMLDLQFLTNRTECFREALQVIQLNPRQTAIPVQLASAFARRYPNEALTILKKAEFTEPERVRDALAIAWRIEPETDVLWSVTPNTPAGLIALGAFASKHNLRPLAIQAFLAAKGRVKNLTLAEAFLELDRPDLALSLISNPPANRHETLIAARAYFKTRDFTKSIRSSESILKDADDIANLARTPSRRLPVPAENPKNQADAERLAGTLCAMDSEPEIERIQELRRLFPKSKPIQWFLFQGQRQARHDEAAARTGLELAEEVVNAR